MENAAMRPLPPLTASLMFFRMLAVQGSWNYETMLGTGIGFSVEPALRALPGGRAGAPYHAALARETHYFNAHPYLAAVAVGALARVELDESLPPAQIERFRIALCGPLGSVGDRLVWAGWLPFTVLVALLSYGLGGGPALVVPLFLVLYNVGHLGLRAWGLRTGWTHGKRVAGSLATPVLRRGPEYLARAVMGLCGLALPLAAARILGRSQLPLAEVARKTLLGTHALVFLLLAVAALLGVALVKLHGRIDGWRVALLIVVVLALHSVAS
ncbi:MAG TPA: PTS system mannose/fructose/sorbose family transporter subunit IID [Gemmatimonadaceae bacterium]